MVHGISISMGLSKKQLMSNVKNIAVIGAGIVGLSTSYYLQSSGHNVTIFDQNDPGSGTSRGHASVIACLLYTSPSPRDDQTSRMPSSA